MKPVICAIALLFSAATANAQTTDTTAPPPAVTSTQAPAQCPDLPPDPTIPDGTHIRMAAMTQASDGFKAWETAAHATLECRRLQYNAVIERSNAVSHAWNAQIDAFCGRRDVHCTPMDRPAEATAPAH